MKSINRSVSFMIIALAYLIAIAVAGVVFWQLNPYLHPLLNMLIADTVATVFMWLSSIIFKNSSMYDPYWSVIPPIVALTYVLLKGFATVNDALMLTAVFVWSIRLTGNWAYTFKGIAHQDWRYTKLKNENPKISELINFFGIQFMPTLFVFGGMLPLYYFVAGSSDAISVFTIIGAFVSIGAAVLQLVADGQMHSFRYRKKQGLTSSFVIESGLWKYSRHPNYLGEILFWWGVFIMGIGIVPWWTVIGALMITALFSFISIPLMEKHVIEKHPEYLDYKKRTSMLLPLPPRNSQNTEPESI